MGRLLMIIPGLTGADYERGFTVQWPDAAPNITAAAAPSKTDSEHTSGIRARIWERPSNKILVIMSFLPAAEKASMLLAPICRLAWLLAPPALLAFLAPASAWCDVYKWTDERGNTVISNIRPADPSKMRNFELVLKERAVQTPPPPSQQLPTPAEQLLSERIASLERQLRARQYPPQVPPATDYGNYSPPPSPPGYYSSYDPNYYYPGAPLYSYAAYPIRTIVGRPRPVYTHTSAMRGGSIHRVRR